VQQNPLKPNNTEAILFKKLDFYKPKYYSLNIAKIHIEGDSGQQCF